MQKFILQPSEQGECFESFDGPTPAGGVRSVWQFFNLVDGIKVPCAKADASSCEILELNSNGAVIRNTMGSMAKA